MKKKINRKLNKKTDRQKKRDRQLDIARRLNIDSDGKRKIERDGKSRYCRWARKKKER